MSGPSPFISSVKLAFVSLFILVVPIFSDIYKIPDHLVAEVKQNKQLFEENKSSDNARFNLAMSYAYTGQIMKGWLTLKELSPTFSRTVVTTYLAKMDAEPKEWRHPFKLGFGYFFAGDKETAIKMFKRVLKIDPRHVWAMGYIALIKGEMGEVNEAIRISKAALKIEPNATGIHFLLGEGYRRKGEYIKFLSQMMIVGRLQSEEALFYGE